MARREFQDPSLLVRQSAQGAEWYFRYRIKTLDVGKDGKPSIRRVEKWRSLGLCSKVTEAMAKREKAKILALRRFRRVEACNFPCLEWVDSLVCRLNAWRKVAVNASNTTLVEMTDHSCSTRDEVQLKTVAELYFEEFGVDAEYQLWKRRHLWERRSF